MKKNIITILFLLLICGCLQQPTVEKNGGIIITASFSEYNRLVKNDLSIIKKKIIAEGLFIQHIVIDSIKNNLTISIPKIFDTTLIKSLFVSTGNISVCQTYENNELFPSLYKINQSLAQNEKNSNNKQIKILPNSTLREKVKQANLNDTSVIIKNGPLFSILIPYVSIEGKPFNGAILGSANVYDTALIMHYLNLPLYKDMYPKDITFAWSVKSNRPYKDGLFFELYALQLGKHNFENFEENITEYKYQTAANKSEYEIYIQLDEKGSKMFTDITTDNVGKCLAIVVGKKVIAAPRVTMPVKEGKLVINGTFSLGDVKNLYNLIRNGILSGSVKITNTQIIKAKS